jgi:transposase InsO family protein
MKAHEGRFSVVGMAHVLGVSRSGYYAWRRRPVCAQEMANRHLLRRIQAIHQHSGATYGSPRVYHELRAQGQRCGRHRVARLMRQAGIQGCQRRRFRHTTRRDEQHPVAPNLLPKRGQPDAPDQVWLSDVTYIPTGQGWLYLASIMDRFSRRIVGWAMGTRHDAALTKRALQMAFGRRRPAAGLLHHSDRGSHYTAATYRRLLTNNHCLVSMSGTGNCYDNAFKESFFATLKEELVHRHRFPTRAAARLHIFAYIEGFYNTRRRHSSLGYLSPRDFELAWQAQIS